MELRELLLPNFWATALAYGDLSGLEDQDIEKVIEWENDHKGWYCITTNDDSSFCKYHDAKHYGILACECSTFTFMVVEE